MRKYLLLSLLAIGITTLAYTQIDLKKGLVAHYKLDGDASDSSGNLLNGSMNGTANDSGYEGKPNTSLKFNGTSDYISVSHNNKLNLNTYKTISLWYKITTLAGIKLYPTLIYKQGKTDYPTFGIFFSEDPAYGSNRHKIGFIQGNSITNKQVFTKEKYTDYLNQWVHIVASYSDNYMRIYFNGQLSDSLFVSNYIANNSIDDMQIGRGNKANFTGNYFKGSLDEIKLYDRGVNNEEVKKLFSDKTFLISKTSVAICQGDSSLIRGVYRKQAGSYSDTVNISANTDSVYITTLNINPTYLSLQNKGICAGDSILLEGSYQTTAGVYYDTLSSSKNCDSIVSTTLTIKTINTNITQNANTLTADVDSATYQWLDCNNNKAPIMGETSKQFVATVNGNYAVRINKDNCTETSNCVSVIGLSTNRNNTFKQSINVYPTPTKNWVKISLGKVYTSVSVTLFTLEGKKLNTSATTNNNSIELSTSEISVGTYLIEIIADGNRAFSKIVIQD